MEITAPNYAFEGRLLEWKEITTKISTKKKKSNLTNDIHDVESFESQPAKVECHRDPNQWLHIVML